MLKLYLFIFLTPYGFSSPGKIPIQIHDPNEALTWWWMKDYVSPVRKGGIICDTCLLARQIILGYKLSAKSFLALHLIGLLVRTEERELTRFALFWVLYIKNL